MFIRMSNFLIVARQFGSLGLFILFVACQFSSEPAFSAESCWAVLEAARSDQNPTAVQPQQLYFRLTPEKFKELLPQIKKLAQEVLRANRDILSDKFSSTGGRPVEVVPGEFTKFSDPEDFIVGNMMAEFNDQMGYAEVFISDERYPHKTAFKIRTNGHVAFIARSYLYRKPEKQVRFRAAFLQDGNILTMDQGELILSTLPENFVIARVMGDEEKQNWVNQTFRRSHVFGTKLHFAPLFFQMKAGDKPVLVPITRTQLTEFYRKGKLELNSYDLLSGDMRMVDNSLGMEYEIVFIGEDAIVQLTPLLRRAILSPPQ